jgi:hypothetical protein
MAWRDLYEYWLGKNRDNRPPTRADLDPPLEIPRLLPNIYIMDMIEEGFRARVIGSEITRRAGRDNTGRMLDPVTMQDRAVPAYAILLRRVVETQAPLIYSAGRGSVARFAAIGLLLPLMGQDETVEMILGGLFYEVARTSSQPEYWEAGSLTELQFSELLASGDDGLYR